MAKYCFLIFCCFHFYTIAQDNLDKTKPLKEVLLYLEQQHRIKFSYSDEVVQGKIVTFNAKNQNIADLIQQLQVQSGLRFKAISKNRYAIILPTEKTTICGHLLSEKDHGLLIGASIIIKHKNKGVSSNSNGFFRLADVLPRDTLRISSIGYRPIEKPVSHFLFKNCPKVFLEEDVTVLEEVIVRNYLTNSITKTIDGAIVFKPKSQTALPGFTDADVLLTAQQLPGILNVDETASGLHIRGGSPDQNLILFNQIKLFNTAHFFGAISALNPQIIDKVTVYKTASNVTYGNHVAGVIDIESNTKISQNASGSVGGNLTHFDANVNVPIASNLSVSIAGRHSVNDLFNSPTYNNLSQQAFQYSIISQNNALAQKLNGTANTDFTYFDFNTSLNYQPTKRDRILFSQINIENDLSHGFSSDEIAEKRTDKLQIGNEGYSLQWHKKWDANTTQTTHASFSKYRLDVRDDNLNLDDGTSYSFIDKKNEVTHWDASLNIDHRFDQKSSISLGYQYVYNEASFSLERGGQLARFESEIENSTNNTHTLYAGYRLKNKKDYALNLGARTNYFSLLDKFALEPRVFAQVKVLPRFWMNTSLEMKQQNISKITENYTKDFGLENTAWVLSNNQRIPLLKSNQITIGALYEYDNWIIDVDFYKRKIDGLTSITSGFEVDRGFYFGEGTSTGLDVLIKKNWWFFNTWVSYQTGKTTFLFREFNDNKAFNGNFDVSHAFYWANAITYKQFNFSLGWTYRVGIPFTSAFIVDFPYLGRNDANGNRLPDYHRLDFTSSYNFHIDTKKNIRGQLGLAILNVYDKENILRRHFDVTNYEDPETGVLVQEDTKSLGFTPNLSFRVKF